MKKTWTVKAVDKPENKITKRVNVNVPISEWDLEDFNEIVYDDEVMSWVFEDRTGKYTVSITFMNDIEYELREN